MLSTPSRTDGRDRTGLTARIITYRARSPVRHVSKALGLSPDRVDALAEQADGHRPEKPNHVNARAEQADWHCSGGLTAGQCERVGIDPASPLGARLVHLANEILGFPRHLSQHVGGMVITRGPLCELVPIENAAMPERTVIEWDKDDLDALNILKVDILALGMLTCVRKAFALIGAHYGRDYALHTIPEEVPEVYEMLSRADSVGVFQVESRAQMTMLPRLKPKTFY